MVHISAGDAKGAADLSAYFFLRANSLLTTGGCAGLIGTDSIASGDTGEIGLGRIISSGSEIYSAVSSMKWPGGAQVSISIVFWIKGAWQSLKLLDGKMVSGINATLSSADNDSKSPEKLFQQICESFAGTYINGDGFILDDDEVSRLKASRKENHKIIFPYIGGDDLNSTFEQIATRHVINFGEMTIEQARMYPECFDIVTQRVKPYRDTLTKQVHESDYWKFWDKRIDSYKKIESFDRVLVAARASKYVQLAFVKNGQVFSDQVVVFITQSDAVFAVLQSSVHSAWAWHWCTKMGQSTLRYAPSKAVATFPPPADAAGLEDFGKVYYQNREAYAQSHRLSLTQIYNNLHDPSVSGDDLSGLRDKHVLLDELTMRSYGWGDFKLDHGFHEVPYLPAGDRTRFTISEIARREILRRLSELNRQRYKQEVDGGLHGVARAPRKARGRTLRAASASEPTLDLGDILPTMIEGGD